MNTENLVKQGELIELTGTPRPDRQAKVLKSCGIKYIVRVDGKIRTTWFAINSALQHEYNDEQPNLDFLNGP